MCPVDRAQDAFSAYRLLPVLRLTGKILVLCPAGQKKSAPFLGGALDFNYGLDAASSEDVATRLPRSLTGISASGRPIGERGRQDRVVARGSQGAAISHAANSQRVYVGASHGRIVRAYAAIG